MKRIATFTFPLLILLLAAQNGLRAENEMPIEQLKGEALHVKLVETALKYDFYNKRCRGVSVSGEMEQANRLFLKKYGLTVNNFIKAYIDLNPRNYQDQVKRELYQQIYQLGGCDASKDKGMVRQFQHDFRLLIDRAEASPWFPLES